MISTKEAADILGISQRRVQKLVKTEALEAKKISGVWLVDKKSVEKRAKLKAARSGRPARGTSRNEAKFTLMNRTHEVMDVVYHIPRKEFSWISPEINMRYAPIGLVTSHIKLPIHIFNKWWRARGIPYERKGLHSLLQEAGVELPQELIQRNLGLSLSDQYWIRPSGSGLKWEDINFFNNDFDDVSLTTAQYVVDGKKAIARPDNTSDGNLQKKWVCRNGTRLLCKSGTVYGQEPYNEVVATVLHKRLLKQKEYVSYSIEGSGAKAVSVCRNFLTDTEEYVPAVYVNHLLNENHYSNTFEHYIACCESLGINNLVQFIGHMIVCDDIIANYDRHWRNFGIIRNIETHTCRPAPIFDSGSSLWCDVETSKLKMGEHSFISKQFFDSPAKQMLLVEDMSWFNIDALEGFVEEAIEILSKNDALHQRLSYISTALKWRVERMLNIAIWD